MDIAKERLQKLMDNMYDFCFDHDVTGEHCEKCPFGNYEDCPLCKFYIECSFAIYNSWIFFKKKSISYEN